MRTCEEFLRALDRARDGEASPEEAREARAHAAACPACAGASSVLDAVSARLIERAGAPDARGVREAVMARVVGGDAVVLELHPFLRRAAVAAAVLFVAATATAVWQTNRQGDRHRLDGGIPREEMLAELGRSRLGPGR